MARQQKSVQVGVVMGSDSDWDVMQHAVAQLAAFGVACEAKVVSAHRTPDAMFAYATGQVASGTPLRAIVRHMLGLYHGQPNARIWRRTLSDAGLLAANRPGLLLDAMEATENGAPMFAAVA